MMCPPQSAPKSHQEIVDISHLVSSDARELLDKLTAAIEAVEAKCPKAIVTLHVSDGYEGDLEARLAVYGWPEDGS